MSELEVSTENTPGTPEQPEVEEHIPVPPPESRFLFVDVAAMRAKQLRRGAKPRVQDPGLETGTRPAKPERMAMTEVRHGLVQWELPEFKSVVDTR